MSDEVKNTRPPALKAALLVTLAAARRSCELEPKIDNTLTSEIHTTIGRVRSSRLADDGGELTLTMLPAEVMEAELADRFADGSSGGNVAGEDFAFDTHQFEQYVQADEAFFAREDFSGGGAAVSLEADVFPASITCRRSSSVTVPTASRHKTLKSVADRIIPTTVDGTKPGGTSRQTASEDRVRTLRGMPGPSGLSDYSLQQ